jgi:hypothetical protein
MKDVNLIVNYWEEGLNILTENTGQSNEEEEQDKSDEE